MSVTVWIYVVRLKRVGLKTGRVAEGIGFVVAEGGGKTCVSGRVSNKAMAC